MEDRLGGDVRTDARSMPALFVQPGAAWTARQFQARVKRMLGGIA